MIPSAKAVVIFSGRVLSNHSRLSYLYKKVVPMTALKKKIIQGINQIEDDELLRAVHRLIQGIQGTGEEIQLNHLQMEAIDEAERDYANGLFLSTEEVFKDLIDG